MENSKKLLGDIIFLLNANSLTVLLKSQFLDKIQQTSAEYFNVRKNIDRTNHY